MEVRDFFCKLFTGSSDVNLTLALLLHLVTLFLPDAILLWRYQESFQFVLETGQYEKVVDHV